MNQKTTKIKIGDLQLDSTFHLEEISEGEAAKIKGGYSLSESVNALYDDISYKSIYYQAIIAPSLAEKDNSGKVQA